MPKPKSASEAAEHWLPPLCAISACSVALTCSMAPSVLAWGGLAASLSTLELDHDRRDCSTCRPVRTSKYSGHVQDVAFRSVAMGPTPTSFGD